MYDLHIPFNVCSVVSFATVSFKIICIFDHKFKKLANLLSIAEILYL
jgi:hypothetical protein